MRTKYRGTELYIKDGKYGVLVAPGKSGGWSTFNEYPELAYDKRVIEFWLSKKDDKEFMEQVGDYSYSKAYIELKTFLTSLGYSKNLCLYGFKYVTLQYVDRNVPWRIVCNCGDEILETLNDYTIFDD